MDIQPTVVYEEGQVANPAPLGLAATAVANWTVAVSFLGWAKADGSAGTSIFYGGLAQFMAGIWCFKRNDTLGALAFCTYGAWWIGLVTFGLLFTTSGRSQFFTAFADPAVELPQAIAWYTLCILIVNTYMLICSLQCPAIAVSNFFWLELSELLLVIGQFYQQPAGTGCIKAGGAVQVILAISCSYAAFANCWNDMCGTAMIPLGPKLLDFTKSKKAS